MAKYTNTNVFNIKKCFIQFSDTFNIYFLSIVKFPYTISELI